MVWPNHGNRETYNLLPFIHVVPLQFIEIQETEASTYANLSIGWAVFSFPEEKVAQPADPFSIFSLVTQAVTYSRLTEKNGLLTIPLFWKRRQIGGCEV